jgi:hypothetical protein
LPPVEQIPVLIPQKALDAIKTEGAYEFVEAVEVPTEGAGGIYTADYFRSVLEYLKQYPMPGSKDGHEAQGNDFYTIRRRFTDAERKRGHLLFPHFGAA